MGCMSSKEDSGDHLTADAPTQSENATLTAEQKAARQQRRRLSVAPQHVGDISKITAQGASAVANETKAISEVEAKAQKKFVHAAKTRKGYVPYNRNKVNQDRAVVKYAMQDDPDMSLFGVMDGHGEFGHTVAAFVQEKLPLYLDKEKGLKKDPDKHIKLGVKKLCDELTETLSAQIDFSGTTCVFGVNILDKLHVANIGDSRCVMCRQTADGGVKGIPLSTDQKPDDPAEKRRILQAGGRVEPLPGPPGEDCGPHRIWLAEVDVPGLAMSRSIGDAVSHTVGVISVPEITTHTITEDDIMAIWASDGVWEFIDSQAAADIVWKHRHDLNKAATVLVGESSERWKQEEEVVDDITCVIVQFNPPKK